MVSPPDRCSHRPTVPLGASADIFVPASAFYSRPVISVGNLADWAGLPVVAQDGSKIGTMESVYYDTSTQEPAFVAVKVGLIGAARLVFVPVDGAVVSPKHLLVPIEKKLARDAPSIATDGQLEAALEPAVY